MNTTSDELIYRYSLVAQRSHTALDHVPMNKIATVTRAWEGLSCSATIQITTRALSSRLPSITRSPRAGKPITERRAMVSSGFAPEPVECASLDALSPARRRIVVGELFFGCRRHPARGGICVWRI